MAKPFNEQPLTYAQLVEIATLMALRRRYSLKIIARQFNVSTKTLYRIERRFRQGDPMQDSLTR